MSNIVQPIIAPIYSKIFSNFPESCVDELKSKDTDLVFPHEVDFSITTPPTWLNTSKSIALCVLKIVIFPWGLYELNKYTIQRALMAIINPAQNAIAKTTNSRYRPKNLDELRKQIGITTKESPLIYRHVTLQKNGVTYSGLMLGHRDTIQNGKWILEAVGKYQTVEGFLHYELTKDLHLPDKHKISSSSEKKPEKSVTEITTDYAKAGFNILLINGPGVGRSQGTATPKTMGEVQELGLTFLETAVQAKKIVLAGFSLGGAAMSEAIIQHTFKKDVEYLSIQKMTFGKLSQLCEEIVKNYFPSIKGLAAPLIRWTGLETNLLAASLKLQELGIPEIIINNGDPQKKPHEYGFDTIIPAEATLGRQLELEGITRNKTFQLLPKQKHYLSPENAIPHIQNWDRPSFFRFLWNKYVTVCEKIQ